MAIDRVHPLKFESAASGGTEDDEFPTGLDKNEDYVDSRGLSVQNDTSDDELVRVSRDAANNLTFQDGVVAGTKTLTQVLATGAGVSEATHKALRDLIHFLDDGPVDGFASGSYKEMTPAADPFPTAEIWYDDNTKVKKLVELAITRNANKTPSVEVWKMYDSDGSTVLVTVTDAIVYSGVFEITRTRTWA